MPAERRGERLPHTTPVRLRTTNASLRGRRRADPYDSVCRSEFVRPGRMALSVFDLFKIGIGPSSSHTVGPMWAALRFVRELEARGVLGQARRVRADLSRSLTPTARGHATDKAL